MSPTRTPTPIATALLQQLAAIATRWWPSPKVRRLHIPQRPGEAGEHDAEFCAIELEARAIAGVSPFALLQPVRDGVEALAAEGIDIEWTPMSDYPALSLAADAPLVKLLEELTGAPCIAAVSYGTEAGLFQAAGIDAIICGPGDIGRAHKPDEFITADELSACQSMLETLANRCTV